MNITLSADIEPIEKARAYAAQQGTSLNQIIRKYLEDIAVVRSSEACAQEFERLARDKGGPVLRDTSLTAVTPMYVRMTNCAPLFH